jgi:multicomponent Na+:H+ antiporter subunit D
MMASFLELLTAQPGLLLILAGIAAVFLPTRINALLLIIAPCLGFCIWLGLDNNSTLHSLQINQIDFVVGTGNATNTFALAFLLISALAGIFSLSNDDRLEQVNTLIYAGATISVLYSQDYLSFFFFWEITAITSAFIVWAGRTDSSYGAGLRYLVQHLFAGVLLLIGIIGQYQQTQSFALQSFQLDHWYEWCFLLAFGIKAAFPFLHTWLPDAYPRSTPTGSVVLSAFTTKMAIYALLVHFTGQKALIVIGCTMAIWPMLYMVLENDLRRVIAYALQNQFGYMVVAIGLGTELAVNGAVAHAFACTLYGGLLYMVTGALIKGTGSAKCSDLGGLAKRYPILLAASLVGGFTIAAFPFFVGFASKSLTLSALSKEHMDIAWLALVFSSVAVIDALAIKLPYFAFIKPAADQKTVTEAKEIPLSMKIAMIALAVICIFPGIFPHSYYQLLPNEKYWDYELNSASHLLTQFQLIVFTALGFVLIKLLKLYPNQYPQTLVDVDILFRKGIPSIWRELNHISSSAKLFFAESRIAQHYGNLRTMSEKIMISRLWPTGSMVIWVVIILVATVMLYLWQP